MVLLKGLFGDRVSHLRSLGATLLSLLIGLAPVSPAFACACCPDAGQRTEHPVDLTPYDIDALDELALAGPGQIYLTACAQECVRGIDWPGDPVTVDITATNGRLVLSVGQAVTLTSPLPAQVIFSAVDLKPGSTPVVSAVHTEYRIPLQVKGHGPGWTAGSDAIPGELILMGDGGLCPELSLATNWLLDVGGRDHVAQFRIFGELTPLN